MGELVGLVLERRRDLAEAVEVVPAFDNSKLFPRQKEELFGDAVIRSRRSAVTSPLSPRGRTRPLRSRPRLPAREAGTRSWRSPLLASNMMLSATRAVLGSARAVVEEHPKVRTTRLSERQ